MALKVWVDLLTFSGGQQISVPQDSIMLVVGPNNSGKSTLLREIEASLRQGQSVESRVVLNKVAFGRHLESESDIDQFLGSTLNTYNKTSGQVLLRGYRVSTTADHAKAFWKNAAIGFQETAPLYCVSLTTADRLTLANPPNQVDTLLGEITHPIHVLYGNPDIEAKFSRFFEQAFGTKLIVNHFAGATVPLHFGTPPAVPAGKDRLSKEYREELKKLPLVHEQGDGIRSFLGMMLAAATVRRFITLLDEPEAFLHPPQARLLGRLLAQEHSNSGQLFVATHSGDVLRGMLDSSSQAITVIRLSRRSGKNEVSYLDPTDIKALWSDPILRFSNILDGMFHEGVVLCESDSDCRFYSAVGTAALEGKGKRVPDVMFAMTGGKDRFPVVAKALLKLNVPLRVVADFDLLADPKKFQVMIETLGGDWKSIESAYTSVKNAIDQKSPRLKANQVIQQIKDALGRVDLNGVFPEQETTQIRAALKAGSYWATAKELGVKAVPPGQPTNEVERLLKYCRECGLWIVPCGELEGFDRSVGRHGPAWTLEVMAKDLANAPELVEARSFSEALMSF